MPPSLLITGGRSIASEACANRSVGLSATVASVTRMIARQRFTLLTFNLCEGNWRGAETGRREAGECKLEFLAVCEGLVLKLTAQTSAMAFYIEKQGWRETKLTRTQLSKSGLNGDSRRDRMPKQIRKIIDHRFGSYSLFRPNTEH